MAPVHPIRIGVQLHPQHGEARALLDAGVAVDRMGADRLWTWDHFFPLYGDPGGRHFECTSLLAAWAAVTERVELGPLVACAAYRNPHLLADVARTVDHLSGGRFVLGLGAGWFERDYEEYGYAFDPPGRRLDLLERTIEAVRERWPRLVPPPVRPVPLLIGGTGPRRTLRVVARHADEWHAMFPDHPGEAEASVAALARWCEVEGRDPATVRMGVGIEPGALGRDLAEHADAYVALGFTDFSLGVNGPAWDLGPVGDWLAWRDERNAG